MNGKHNFSTTLHHCHILQTFGSMLSKRWHLFVPQFYFSELRIRGQRSILLSKNFKMIDSIAPIVPIIRVLLGTARPQMKSFEWKIMLELLADEAIKMNFTILQGICQGQRSSMSLKFVIELWKQRDILTSIRPEGKKVLGKKVPFQICIMQGGSFLHFWLNEMRKCAVSKDQS